MSRTKISRTDRSKRLALRLMPLFAHVPSASKAKFALNAPRGPMLMEDIERHVQDVIATVPPGASVYISRTKLKRLLAGLRMPVSRRGLPALADAINSAINEYVLRLYQELTPLSSWLPRYEKIVVLLRKVRPLLPDREKDELLFRIISHFGESYAASHGPHQGLPPYELENPLDNVPFTVNYRSDERLEQVIAGIKEIANWMKSFLDAEVGEFEVSPTEEMSAAVWLTGYELPRIYEEFFPRQFGVSLSTTGGARIRFVIRVLDAAGIVASSGKRFSPQTIKTYRRRAQRAISKVGKVAASANA